MKTTLALLLTASAASAQPWRGRDLRDVELGCWNKRWKDCDLATTAYFQGAPHAGLTADPQKAASLLEQACDRGMPQGCVKLGMILEEGKKLPQDFARADALSERACRMGWSLACPGKAEPSPARKRAAKASKRVAAAAQPPDVIERGAASDRGPLDAS